MADPQGFVELRGQVPKLIVDVLDAVSLTKRVNRWELVNEILSAYADDRMREATAIMRVTTARDER